MKSPFFLLTALAFSVHALEADNMTKFSIQIGSETIAFSPPRGLAFFNDGALKKKCSLNFRGTDFFLSHDKNAVILGGNHYIEISNLLACDPNTPLHSRQISISSTLTDINLTKELYVAVNIVETSPQFFCIATVGHLHSTRNLVRLPGADNPGTTDRENQETAFECPDRSLISNDGRYVSVMPDVDCNEFSYPGVWDLRSNTKVEFSKDILSEQEISKKCRGLFFPETQ